MRTNFLGGITAVCGPVLQSCNQWLPRTQTRGIERWTG